MQTAFAATSLVFTFMQLARGVAAPRPLHYIRDWRTKMEPESVKLPTLSSPSPAAATPMSMANAFPPPASPIMTQRSASATPGCRKTKSILTQHSQPLTAGLTEFTSAEPVNEFLSRLLLLLGQNRISPRRAAVLAYIATQILRTIVVLDREGRHAYEQTGCLRGKHAGDSLRSPVPRRGTGARPA